MRIWRDPTAMAVSLGILPVVETAASLAALPDPANTLATAAEVLGMSLPMLLALSLLSRVAGWIMALVLPLGLRFMVIKKALGIPVAIGLAAVNALAYIGVTSAFGMGAQTLHLLAALILGFLVLRHEFEKPADATPQADRTP